MQTQEPLQERPQKPSRARVPLPHTQHGKRSPIRQISVFALTALALLLVGALAPAASQAQQNPAQTLVGRQVTSCKADVRFRFTVVAADWSTRIVDRAAAAGTMWAVAVADVTNLGPRLEYPQGLVTVQDEQGRLFPWQLFNGADLYVETDLASQYGVTPSWEGIERNATQRTVLIFPVAADARSLTLLPADLACAAAGPGMPPAVSHPAASLIGQSVTACKGELQFRFEVVDADWRKTIVDRTATGTAMWAVVIADVTNLGPFADAGQGLAKVRDDRGREFSWRLFNGENLYVEDQIAAEFGLRPSWDVFTPGITERTVLLFEVAGDARSLGLLPDNLGCGG
jgi:hypothetical protein